jgi:hypothetical protein
MKRKQSWLYVILWSLLAGLFMSATGMLGMMPRFYYDFGDAILMPVLELLGEPEDGADTLAALIFCFLTGFVPVFLIGTAVVLLKGTSPQGTSSEAERPQ